MATKKIKLSDKSPEAEAARARLTSGTTTSYSSSRDPTPSVKTFQAGPTIAAAERLKTATGGAKATQEQIYESLSDPAKSTSSRSNDDIRRIDPYTEKLATPKEQYDPYTDLGPTTPTLNLRQEQVDSILSGKLKVGSEMEQNVLDGKYTIHEENFFQKMAREDGTTWEVVLDAMFAGRLGLGKTGIKTGIEGESKSILAKSKDSLKFLKSKLNTKKILTDAEKAGTRIDAAGGLVKVGTKTPSGRLIKNDLEAKLINDMIISSAKRISPSKWKILLGLGTTSTGVGTAIIGMSIWSGMDRKNSYGDTIQTLSYRRDDFYKDGDIERGDEIQDLMDEATELYEDGNEIWASPWTAATQKKSFIDSTKSAGDKLRESMVEKQAGDELRNKLDERFMSEIDEMTSEEILNDSDIKEFALDPENWSTRTVEAFARAESQADWSKTETESIMTEISNALNTDDERLMRKKLAMTDEEFINDPEVIAFIQDSANSFSGTLKLYDQAFARFAGQSGGVSGGEAGGYSVGPSTLNFGLLNTGGEYIESDDTGQVQEGVSDIPVEGESLEEKDKPEENSFSQKDSASMQRYGKMYNELTSIEQENIDRGIYNE